MATKVLSIEVGQATTRVVEMDYKVKNPKIYSAFTVATPDDVVQDGVVAHSEEFLVAIKGELRRRMIKTNKVVFTVASGRIANREARIPFCKEKNILPIVMANASDYFPVDMNQYHLSYTILGTVEGGEGEGKQYRLSLLAVPNDITTSYVDLARSLELEIKAIDYVGNSVFQAVKDDIGASTSAFLKVEEHASLITVISNGEIVLQRLIAHGLNNAIQNLMETDMFQDEELTYEGAARKFVENKIIRPHLSLDAGVSSEDANEEDLMVRVMITEQLRYLVGNTSRVIEYFVSRNQDKNIENVYLVGLGAEFQGLAELLTNELGVAVKPYAGLDHLKPASGDTTHSQAENMNTLIGPIGAAIAPLQLLSADLLKEEKELNLAIPGFFAVLCVAAAVVLVIGGKIWLAAEKSETKKLQKTLDSYADVDQTINKYQASVVTYRELRNVINSTQNSNNNLTTFLAALEEKMPSSFGFTSFTATPSGANMTCRVTTKDEIAAAISQMRTIDTVLSVTSSSFTESETDDYWEFTVDVVFNVEAVEILPADDPALAAGMAEDQVQ